MCCRLAVGQADSQSTHRQALGTSGRCKKWGSARLRLWKVDVAMPMLPCVWKTMYRALQRTCSSFPHSDERYMTAFLVGVSRW